MRVLKLKKSTVKTYMSNTAEIVDQNATGVKHPAWIINTLNLCKDLQAKASANTEGNAVEIEDIGTVRKPQAGTWTLEVPGRETVAYTTSKRLLDRLRRLLTPAAPTVDEKPADLGEQQAEPQQQLKPPRVMLPYTPWGWTVTKFANAFGEAIGKARLVFLHNDSVVYVEEPSGKLIEVSPDMLCTLPAGAVQTFERKVLPGRPEKGDQPKAVERDKDMGVALARTVLASRSFRKHLPVIKRVYRYPVPTIADGKLTLPKPGYDPIGLVYFTSDCPQVQRLSIHEARRVLGTVYSKTNFPWYDNQSLVHARAALITPMLREILGDERTPMWAFVSNGPRAGKDYAAEIRHVLYCGTPSFNEGFPTKGDGADKDIAAKITTVVHSANPFLHAENITNYVFSTSLMRAVTNKVWNERMYMGNSAKHRVSVPNLVDYSLSGICLGWEQDIDLRIRGIYLKLEVENANARTFETPYLHEYVLENRTLILSAAYTLIAEWADAGCPKGETPFASFKRWAEVCGGIITVCKLGDPCLAQENPFGGDVKTKGFEQVLRLIHEEIGEAQISRDNLMQLLSNEARHIDDALFDLPIWRDKKTVCNAAGRRSLMSMLKPLADTPLGGIVLTRWEDSGSIRRVFYRFSAKGLTADGLEDEHGFYTARCDGPGQLKAA